jgi:hypothetical protein
LSERSCVIGVHAKGGTLCSIMRNPNDQPAKVGVASMRQGSRGHELNGDRGDRDPNHRCQLPFGDHGAI